MENRRPIGVILFALWNVYSVIRGVILQVPRIVESNYDIKLVTLFLLLNIVTLWVTYALLRMRNWARVITVIFSGIGAAATILACGGLGLIVLIGRAPLEAVLEPFTERTHLIIDVLYCFSAYIYFTRPKVKQAFQS